MEMKTHHNLSLVILFICFFFTFANITYSQITGPILITTLDSLVEESSGLLFYNGKLWTHNDSDNFPKLFQIDTISGEVISTKTLKNIDNIDWEDLTMDDEFAYIGDFGNNAGNRENFQIYKFPLSELDNIDSDSITAETITFYYNPDYYSIPEKATKNDTNFDCEAMIVKDDSIYLFSKNWVDKKCYFYAIPKIPGNYMANLRDL
jgi:hypothetical protein